MLYKNYTFLYYSLFLCLTLSFYVFSDEIYLKNGNTIEGVIKKETSNHIILDLGVGSTKIAKSKIKSIKRSKVPGNTNIKEEWRKKYFLHKRHIPHGFEAIAKKYIQISSMRDGVIRTHQNIPGRENDEIYLLKEIMKLEKYIVTLSTTLSKASPKENVRKYNLLVAKINTAKAKLGSKYEERKKIEKRKINDKKNISNYIESLSEFTSLFYQRFETTKHKKTTKNEQYFIDRISDNLKKFNSEVSNITVSTTADQSGTTVIVVVNGIAQGKFILDTGATLVTISAKFAKRANIGFKERRKAEIIVADGRKINGEFVRLKSVQLGDAYADNVEAIILPPSKKIEMDGLLGMSFLKNFSMHMDGASGKLILTRFIPQK